MSKLQKEVYQHIIKQGMSWGTSGRPTSYKKLISKKYHHITCSCAASIGLQRRGCLAKGKMIRHKSKTGGAKRTKSSAIVGWHKLKNCRLVYVNRYFAHLPVKYKTPGNVFVYDSDMSTYLGNGVIASCNCAGKQTAGKVYHKHGYQHTHKILWVIIPK